MLIRDPKRVDRTYEQRLAAPPERVFPLLCPVREKDWVPGWDPVVVYSLSGVAEDDCVFLTPGRDTSPDAVWVVTRYEPAQFRIEFVRVVPGVTASRIRIALQADDDVAGPCTRARVGYQHTSLGAAGDALVDGYTEEVYRDFMQTWERNLNAYLKAEEADRGAEASSPGVRSPARSAAL